MVAIQHAQWKGIIGAEAQGEVSNLGAEGTSIRDVIRGIWEKDLPRRMKRGLLSVKLLTMERLHPKCRNKMGV